MSSEMRKGKGWRGEQPRLRARGGAHRAEEQGRRRGVQGGTLGQRVQAGGLAWVGSEGRGQKARVKPLGMRSEGRGTGARVRPLGVQSEGRGAGARVRLPRVWSKGLGARAEGEGQAPGGRSEGDGRPGRTARGGSLPLPTRPGRSLRVASHPILHPTPSLRWVARVEPESRPRGLPHVSSGKKRLSRLRREKTF